jgi:PAS domain S-box-containing protein
MLIKTYDAGAKTTSCNNCCILKTEKAQTGHCQLCVSTLEGYTVKKSEDPMLIQFPRNPHLKTESGATFSNPDDQAIKGLTISCESETPSTPVSARTDSSSLLQTILAPDADSIITFNIRTRLIEAVNIAAEKMFGYSKADLIGKDFDLIVADNSKSSRPIGPLDDHNYRRRDNRNTHPVASHSQPSHTLNHHQEPSQEESSCNESRDPKNRRLRFEEDEVLHSVMGIFKGGQTFPLEMSGADLQLRDQHYFTAVLRNVATRKSAEAIIRQTEDRYRTLFNAIEEGFCTAELIYEDGQPVNLRIVNANPAFAKQTGFAEVEGKYVLDLEPNFDTSSFAVYDRIVRFGESVRFVHHHKMINRWFDVYACPESSHSHNIAILFTDITEQKNAEQASHENEHYLRAVIDALPVAIYTTDANGLLTHFNHAAVEFSGRTPVLGQDRWCINMKLFQPDGSYLPHDQCAMATALMERRQILGVEGIAERPDGSRVWFNAYPTPLFSADGKLLGGINMMLDITERKRLDQIVLENNIELKKAKYLADKANLAKSQFLSNMSHELRTPLNAILGFAQLIEASNPPPSASQKRSIEQVLQAGWYLLNLINEILDLTLIESGKLSLSIEPVSIADLLLECKTIIEPSARARNLTLDFPELDDSLHVIADQIRLKQILINLLSNAVKYNREKGKVVVTCSESTEQHLRIAIADTGVGLTPEHIAQLFQPFNRLGRERGPEEGTGIGLVMTKRLTELMGAKINVDSTVGEGTVFWFELERLTQNRINPKNRSSHNERALKSLVDENIKHTLLYVEDNPANLMLVEDMIASYPNVTLLSARDGYQAIEIARLAQPDVILMDIHLPGIDGTEVLKMLAKDPLTTHIPVIALSAHAIPRDIESGLRAGFFRYITKPIKLNELMTAISLALDVNARKLTKEYDETIL